MRTSASNARSSVGVKSASGSRKPLSGSRGSRGWVASGSADTGVASRLRATLETPTPVQSVFSFLSRTPLRCNSCTSQSINDVLVPQNHIPATSSAIAAQLLRPARVFKEAAHAAKVETCGRKRKHAPTDSVRTNWREPHLAQQIIDAGRATGSRLRPTEIQRYLWLHHPAHFSGITTQVIGRYMEKKDGHRQWKKEFLDLAASTSGLAPGGKATHPGILVSLTMFYTILFIHSLILV